MRKQKFIRVLLIILAVLLFLLIGFYIYFKIVTRVSEPEIPVSQQTEMHRVTEGTNVYSCEHGWLRKEREGWWLMYLEGSPYEVGYAHGLLTKELNYNQEKAFLKRLGELIPSKLYQDFMLAFVRFFNRNLDGYVKEEYREEIYGISRFASPEFGFMGPAYARMLNYHAAHDLGHAVQNMNLVACTAFGAWGSHSSDSSLVIGRNFDFFVSDDFANDKILCIIRPDSGYSFAMITWAGFAGVVSGMNEKGLTVTLNAAKSSIPMGAKTPVSLLAREILQYASNIEEAIKIAKSRETFVAESFFIGSAADHKAVVIEKSPEKIAIYDPDTNSIVVTNHFQSDTFMTDPLNIDNIENETSVYRLERVKELLSENPQINPGNAAAILRDYHGLQGKDIGLGNEKAVNQFIAHHSVIFEPESRCIWVAGPPYQLGEYWGYDLDSLVNGHRGRDVACNVSTMVGNVPTMVACNVSIMTAIPIDTIQLETIYPTLQKYRALAQKIESGQYAEGDADSLVHYNPEYFGTYRVLGDYFKAKDLEHRAKGVEHRAEEYYRIALEKEAPSAAERKAAVGSRQ
jgi:isopenicillin-N N-acyltransferase like protein